MSQLLTDDEISSRLKGLDWQRQGEHIVRDLKFANFREAMAFVDRVADAAEEANHHPDILVHGWNNVRLSITNHSAGGLTDADFKLAAKVETMT
jgi:4a-hydroxytetrahydrobiopterin dehydratase